MIIKGCVEYKLINKYTQEVEQVHQQDNTITLRMRERMTQYAQWGSSITSDTILGTSIVISSDTNDSVSDFVWVRSPIFGFTPVGVTSPQVFEKTQVSPIYSQWVKRFDPPATGQTRTINTIGLTTATAVDTGTDKAPVSAYVKLSSPCIQTDTQLLDVTYRIQWIRDPLNTVGFTADDTAFYWFVQRLVTGYSTANPPLPTAINHLPMHTSLTPEGGLAGRFILQDPLASEPGFSGTGVTLTYPAYLYPLFKRVVTGVGTTSATVGKIIGTEAYTSGTTYYAHSWRNIVAPTGSNVQPIHSHAASTFSSATPTPFLDAQPATGTGKLIGGGTWTNPNYPEEYMIKITGTGNVGTSTYQMWKRNHFGFDGTSYVNRHIPLAALSSRTTYNGDYSTNIPFPPLVGSHGVLQHAYTEQNYAGSVGTRSAIYDFTRIITTDNTGITLINLSTTDYINFDATTTPALPVTQIRQVSVNRALGEIWVACENTGLWKISSDFSTITHITVATHGVPSEQSYGVDIGRLNSIWAAFNGGLASSFDNGVTWTAFNPATTPAFTFTGISDANWNTINYIKVDPEHANDQLIIVRKPGTTVLNSTGAVWWSYGNPTATAITGLSDTAGLIARASTHMIDVSDTESFWASAPGVSTAARKLTWGSSTMTAFGTTSTLSCKWVAFERGPSNQQCFIYITGADPYTVTLYDKNLTAVATGSSGTASQGESMMTTSPESNRMMYLGKGIATAIRYSTTTDSTVAFAQVIGTVLDTPNTFVGPFSYAVWEKYGWNGSSWELNHAGSKTTHLTQESLLNGTTLSFANGVTGTSFTNNEYYTFGVTPGILKDNSIAYNTYTSFYFAPTKTSTVFGGNVRPYPSVGTVTWKFKSSQLTVNPDQSLVNTSTSRQYGLYAISNNRVFGDFVITGTVSPGGTPRYISIGLTPTLGGAILDDTVWYSGTPNAYEFRMTPSNGFQPAVNGTLAGTNTTITVPGTTWEIRRVGTTLTFYIGGVLKHTVASVAIPSFVVRVLYSQQTSTLNSQTQETVHPITVVSSGTGYYTEAGSFVSGEGIYDPNFISIDVETSVLPALQVMLNGVPVTAKITNSTTVEPGPGEVVIYSSHGDFIFNAADNGKAVTGSYTYTKK